MSPLQGYCKGQMQYRKNRLYNTETPLKYQDDGSSLVAQQVKDLTVSLLWLRFSPWSGTFCTLQAQSKEQKANKQKSAVAAGE